MAVFVYKARSRTGEKVEGTVEAHDRRAATAQLEAMGHVPISVMEQSGAAAKAKGTGGGRRFTIWHGREPRMGTRDVLLFTTELSDLLASGMTLGNALNCLANRKTGKAGDDIITSLRDEIIRGTSLSDALAKHPASFPNLYVNMIRAGEASGALHEILRRLVDHFERVGEAKEKVTMALAYPAIVVTLGVIILIIMMLKVVPQFEKVFDSLGSSLPLPTQILVSTSRGMARYGWIGLIALTIGGILAQRAISTPKGRLWWHGWLLRMPVIRGIIASGTYTNFAQTLATLLRNGVPVLGALQIVEQTVGNAVIAREIRNARERVTDGTTISGPLAAGKVFPVLMTDMLAIGEQTGDMPGALSHIARRYESDLNRNIKLLTTLLEPLLIVIVALMIGFVAVSILMAVFNMTNGLSV